MIVILIAVVPVSAFGDVGAMLELAPGATMADALTALDLPAAESYVTLVNGEIVRVAERARRRLAQGDALIVFPPIKGG